MSHRHPRPTLFPYTTLFRSQEGIPRVELVMVVDVLEQRRRGSRKRRAAFDPEVRRPQGDHDEEDDDDGRETNEDFYRSEEHTSELQSLRHLVCRLLLEKKKK